MDFPWSSILQGALTVGGIMVVNYWIGRSPRLARSREGRLFPPWSMLALGLVCFAFFAGILVLSNLYPNDTVTWFTNTVFATFALAGLAIVIGYCIDRITFDSTSFNYANTYGLRRTMRWADVVSVRYKPAFKWFLFEDRSGRKARPNVMLVGLPAFAREALAHVPANAFDEETRAILVETAAGEPPTIT